MEEQNVKERRREKDATEYDRRDDWEKTFNIKYFLFVCSCTGEIAMVES